MYWLDPIGASLSLLCTYYFTQARRRGWIVGIFAISCNLILYWQKEIYGYFLLEIFYFCTMFMGWQQWSNTKNKEGSVFTLRSLSLKEWINVSIITLLGIVLLAQALLKWTPSNIPYWDATTTCLSLLAQTLLCFKIIQCWLLWFIVDALIAALQFYKGIPFHSALHAIYLIFAVLGFYKWRKLSQSGKM